MSNTAHYLFWYLCKIITISGYTWVQLIRWWSCIEMYEIQTIPRFLLFNSHSIVFLASYKILLHSSAKKHVRVKLIKLKKWPGCEKWLSNGKRYIRFSHYKFVSIPAIMRLLSIDKYKLIHVRSRPNNYNRALTHFNFN